MKIFLNFFGLICCDFSQFHRKNPENTRARMEHFSKFHFGFWKGHLVVEPSVDKNQKSRDKNGPLDGYRARIYRRQLQSMIDNLTIGPGHIEVKTSIARYENASKFTPEPKRSTKRRNLFKKYHDNSA